MYDKHTCRAIGVKRFLLPSLDCELLDLGVENVSHRDFTSSSRDCCFSSILSKRVVIAVRDSFILPMCMSKEDCSCCTTCSNDGSPGIGCISIIVGALGVDDPHGNPGRYWPGCQKELELWLVGWSFALDLRKSKADSSQYSIYNSYYLELAVLEP